MFLNIFLCFLLPCFVVVKISTYKINMVHFSLAFLISLLPSIGQCLLWTGCSWPSTTPLDDSFSQRGAPSSSPRFSAIFAGCGSRSGSSSIYASFCTRCLDGTVISCSEYSWDGQLGNVQRSTLTDRAFKVAASWA